MQELLLLHGAISTKDQFKELIPALDEFNCSAIDFSGHGNSSNLTQSFSIELFAQDVINWMDENGEKCIDIFGYSMGGYVAMYLAIHYPEKVNRIFTLATKYDWTPENAAKEVQLLDPAIIETKVPKFARKLDSLHSNWRQVLNKTSEMMIQLGDEPAIKDNDWSKIYHSILIGCGDQDYTASSTASFEMFNKLSNSQLAILPNTQHPIEKVDLSLLSIHIKKFFIR